MVRKSGFPRSSSWSVRGRERGCGGGGAGVGVGVPRPWLVVVGMRVDVICTPAVVCCARGPTSSSSVLLLPHSAAARVWRRGRRWRGGRASVAACLRRGAGRRSCPTLRRRRAVFWGRLRLPSATTSHPSSYSLSSVPTAPGCRVGGCPAGRARCGVEGTQRAVGWMSGDHDRCFSTLVLEAFRQVFFDANALPCITIGADVWGECSWGT